MRRMVCLNPEEAFHIHTWRCGHAGDEREDGKMPTLELPCIWAQNKSHSQIMPHSRETLSVEE